MTGLTICSDKSGELIGLQAGVTKYSATTNLALGKSLENVVGTVSGNCKSIKVDPTKKDYVEKMILSYDSK